jgi:AcrR family transcriptional regulator
MVQIAAIPSTDRVEQKKREILHAASAVFRRKGLHATGMRDIAAELGMHAGNLYYYFSNKQELLAFCQEDTLTGLINLASEVRTSDESPARKLRQLIVGHVERLNETTPGSLAHLDVEALDEPWRGRIQRQRDRYEEMIRDLLRQGAADGSLQVRDEGLTARAVLGALNWTVRWFRSDGSRSASDVGQAFADMFLHGLLRTASDQMQEPTL